MSQYKYLNQSTKPNHKPNTRLERIATGSLLAFVLLLPTCQPVRADEMASSHANLTILADEAVSGYDERLSKTQSGQPFRYPLAFVPDVCPASQTDR